MMAIDHDINFYLRSLLSNNSKQKKIFDKLGDKVKMYTPLLNVKTKQKSIFTARDPRTTEIKNKLKSVIYEKSDKQNAISGRVPSISVSSTANVLKYPSIRPPLTVNSQLLKLRSVYSTPTGGPSNIQLRKARQTSNLIRYSTLNKFPYRVMSVSSILHPIQIQSNLRPSNYPYSRGLFQRLKTHQQGVGKPYSIYYADELLPSQSLNTDPLASRNFLSHSIKKENPYYLPPNTALQNENGVQETTHTNSFVSPADEDDKYNNIKNIFDSQTLNYFERKQNRYFDNQLVIPSGDVKPVTEIVDDYPEDDDGFQFHINGVVQNQKPNKRK